MPKDKRLISKDKKQLAIRFRQIEIIHGHLEAQF